MRFSPARPSHLLRHWEADAPRLGRTREETMIRLVPTALVTGLSLLCWAILLALLLLVAGCAPLSVRETWLGVKCIIERCDEAPPRR